MSTSGICAYYIDHALRNFYVFSKIATQDNGGREGEYCKGSFVCGQGAMFHFGIFAHFGRVSYGANSFFVGLFAKFVGVAITTIRGKGARYSDAGIRVFFKGRVGNFRCIIGVGRLVPLEFYTLGWGRLHTLHRCRSYFPRLVPWFCQGVLWGDEWYPWFRWTLPLRACPMVRARWYRRYLRCFRYGQRLPLRWCQ